MCQVGDKILTVSVDVFCLKNDWKNMRELPRNQDKNGAKSSLQARERN